MSLETTCKQFWLLETAVLYEECTNLIENNNNNKSKQFTLFSERKDNWR